MKKILSILMILVLAGGVAFAQFEPTVSGSATLEWGIDFGAGSETDYKKGGNDNHAVATHGFKNTQKVAIRIPFFVSPKAFPVGGSANKEADVYATVAVSPKAPVAGSVNSTIAEASLNFYGFYMSVLKPQFVAGKAVGWDPINAADGGISGWFNPKFSGYGTKIGYKKADLKGLDVGLKLGSNGSWDQFGSDDTKPSLDAKDKNYKKDVTVNGRRDRDSKYGFGLDFAMQPVEKYLGVSATLNATLGRVKDKSPIKKADDHGYIAGVSPKNVGGEKGDDGMVNFGVALTSEPIEAMKVTLGFDGATGVTYTKEKSEKSKTVSTLGWDMGLKVEYKWVEAALYVAGAGTDYDGWDYSAKDSDKHKDYGMNMAAHVGFKSSDKEGDSTNFVKNLGLHATLNVYDLLTKKNANELKDKDERKGAIRTEKQEVLMKSSQVSTLPMGFNLGASYKIGLNSDVMWVKPYAELYGETNHYKQHKDTYTKSDGTEDSDKFIDKYYLGLAYELGVLFQPVEKVEVSAKWKHGKLNADKFEGGFKGNYMIADPIQHKNHNGTFVLGLKLTY